MQVRVTNSRMQTRSYIISCLYFMFFFLLFKSPLSAQTAEIPAGSGTFSDPYLITNLNNLYWLSQTTTAWSSGMYFEQVANIDASTTASWDSGKGFSPIGKGTVFYGNYNGMNYSITGLYINRPTEDYTALFNKVSIGRLINLRLENVNITGSGYTGAMVGQLSDTLLNCFSSGTVKGNNFNVGGLVGAVVLNGKVYYCGSSVNVENTGASNKIGTGGLIGTMSGGAAYNSYAVGNVKGPAHVGGFVGGFQSGSTTVDCYARGSAEAIYSNSGGFSGREPGSGSTMLRCYSTGTVTAPLAGGGLVGGSSPLPERVIASFWDTQTSGLTISMGGTGKTTAEMKTNSTFTDSGWNFSTTWNKMDSINNGYPYLLPIQGEIPTVTTLTADNITSTGARLNGRINPIGLVTQYYFEYKTGTTIRRTDTLSAGSGTTDDTVRISVAGLTSASNYTFKIFAFNASGTAEGSIMQFTTSSQSPPIVITGSAEPVYQTIASITGTVNPAGTNTKVVVEYGTSTGYGFVSDTADISGGIVAVPVNIKLTGLTQGTLYHYRIKAIYSGGSITGFDSVLTTRTNPIAIAPSGTGSYNNPRKITRIENLLWVSQNSSSWSNYFLQINDVDAAETQYWFDGAGFPTIGGLPFVRFHGIYAGQGYTIRNLYINRPENSAVGLIGEIGGFVLDLNIEDAFVRGTSNVGILAGSTSGTVKNSRTSGRVEALGINVGGLIGNISSGGKVSYSSSSAQVYGDTAVSIGAGGLTGSLYLGELKNCFATGNVYGYSRVGGLVGGQSSANLRNSYARGNVYCRDSRAGGLIGLVSSTPTIVNSYSTGSVAAPSSMGGLVGSFSSPVGTPTFLANFWDQESSGMTTSAVGYPRTTLEMKTNSTFTDSNWNWGIDWSRENNINDGYPYLVPPPPTLPTIATGSAAPVGITTASIKSTAIANAVETRGYFEYGTTNNYGMRTDTVFLGWALFTLNTTKNLTGLQPNTQYHYRFVAYNADTVAYGLDSVFTTLPNPSPSVMTLKADNITPIGARLNGIVNANGFATQYYFEYKTDSTVKRTDTLSAGSGAANDTVHITVTGLTPASAYTFKIFAFSSGGNSSGGDSSFTTLAQPAPAVVTLNTDSIAVLAARFNGTVNPEGADTWYYFEYIGASDTMRTDTVFVGNDSVAVSVNKYVTGLSANTNYSVKLIAYNSGGLTQGNIVLFKTKAYKPHVVTTAATQVTTSSGVVNGTVNASGDSSYYYFEYGTTSSFGSVTDTSSAGNGETPLPRSKTITQLQPGVRYYYRIVAYNSGGKAIGLTSSFVTGASSLLIMTSPVGGEGFEPMTEHEITWTSQAVDSVKIEYSSNNGSSWSEVINSYPAAGGSYIWNIPTGGTTQGRIQISSIGITPVLTTTGTGVFSIGSSSFSGMETGTGSDINGTSFSGNNDGTMVGDSGLIVNTSDGGSSWSPQSPSLNREEPKNLNSVSTPSSSTRFAVGDQGTILKTTNGGTIWSGITLTNNHYYGVSFSDTLYGTIVGSNGVILRTTDRGANWSEQTSGTVKTLRDIYSSNQTHGSVVGDEGTILFSSNGGGAWGMQNSGTVHNLNGVYFIKNAGLHQIGYAVGDSGVILKTTNGGSDWVQKTSNTRKNLKSLSFFDAQKGTVAGEAGLIMRTSNGGETWVAIVNPGNSNFSRVAIPEGGVATYVAGSGGKAYKDTLGLVPVELTSFTSSVKNGEVKLQWTTATETNNAGFEVERTNNKEWIKVGYVEGKGTTTQASSYIYTQKNVNTGTYLYRLKQKDFDGKYSYSPEIEVTVAAPLEFVLNQNYPNPFNPSTLIKYQLPEATEVTLKVYDIQGRQIATIVNQKQEAGYYSVNFEAGKLSSGVYIYRLEAGANRKTMKMLLLK